MPDYIISGRVVATDGSPRANVIITVFERASISSDVKKAGGYTLADGRYKVTWTETEEPRAPWDLFVRGADEADQVDSALISHLDGTTTSATVDLIFGEGSYRGRAEFDRVKLRLLAPLEGRDPSTVSVDKLEWLAKRADVYPLHVGAFVQAHRLGQGRSVGAASFYGLLRAGLPGDLASLLRAGEPAWADALRRAWAERILELPGDGSPTAIEDELGRLIEELRALVIEAAVSEPAAGASLRALLDVGGFGEDEQREITRAWVDRDSVDGFWQALRDPKTLGVEKVEQLQFTIHAANLVKAHTPTLAALQAAKAEGQLAGVQDLAGWTVEDWETLLEGATVDAPEEIEGADEDERRRRYAQALARVVEDAYPTAVLRHALERDEDQDAAPAHTDQVAAFLVANPEFEIIATSVPRWLAEHPEALAPVEDAELARANLERVQRIYRFTPRLGRYATVKALLDHGIAGAVDVVARTRSEFVAELAPLLPTVDHDPVGLAGQIWDRASKVHGTTAAIVSSYGLAGSQIAPTALEGIGAYSLEGEGLDELGGVLGTFDYCACVECRSVLSPAAYLADLLHFLAERPAEPGPTALDVLRARRPDIPELLLDCANTTTPLPYIDLVNEALEATLAGGLGPEAKQTRASAAELRLHPEHLDVGVYQSPALTEAVHPWVLPLSLPTLEARAYLEHLDAPRHELMGLLELDGQPSPSARAAEALGLSAAVYSLIAGELGGDGREGWGFSPGPGSDNWDQQLATDVGELLRRSQLSLEELEARLELTFIDPEAYSDVAPIHLSYGESCDLAGIEIHNLDAAALDRLHRFVRLERATGIPARMLNVLVDDVVGQLDAAFLEQLVDVVWLHERLGVPWDELATWWAPRVDARLYPDGPSLYRRRFCSPELEAPSDFVPTPRGNALFGEDVTPPPLTDAHLSVIGAATGLRSGELEALFEAQIAEATFTFANLTALFGAASMCRAASLEAAELIRLRGLLEIDPFASPAEARRFVERLDQLRGVDTRTLDWLLRSPPQLEVSMRRDAEVAAALGELAEGSRVLDDPARRETLAVEILAGDLELSTAACRELLTEVLTDPGEDGPLLAAFAEPFASPEELAEGLSREQQPKLFLAHDKLRKAAFVVRELGLEAGELSWFSGGPGWLDLDTLPLSDGDADATAEAWFRLRDAARLRRLFPAQLNGQRAMAEADSLEAALALLAEHTGWDVNAEVGLGFVAAQLGWTEPAVFADERNLARLRAVVRLVQRLGVSAATLWAWVHEPLDFLVTAQIKQAARSKYDEARWAELARPLRDRLRERQRDALVAAAVEALDGVDTPTQLAERLLIDVEMSACMLTTRIKQAISSVQTFVNRALLGLEAGVSFGAEAAARWEWAKSYRIWEANRKVFLYPENWIAPELRLDKSPEFEALEAALAQGELTEAATEAALAGYVEGLQVLSKLEIVACYQRSEGGDLWVLGRTQAEPHRHFLRRRSAGRWLPWEELRLQIDSDNVVLVERGGKLFLFWLMRQGTSMPGAEPKSDYDHYRLWIHWSEQLREGWSEVRSSEVTYADKLAAEDAEGHIPDDRYYLRVDTSSPRIELRAYVCESNVKSWYYARFIFDPASRRIRFAGRGKTVEAPGELQLEVGARVDGQRVVQGSLPVTLRHGIKVSALFSRPTRGDAPALVRQSNSWRTYQPRSPLFFDDHERAYLVTICPPIDKADAEGDELGLDSLGALELGPALAPPAPEAPPPGEALEITPSIQIIKDALEVPQPWSLAAPGVEPALFELGGELELIPEPAQILAEAQAMASMSDAYLPPEGGLDPDGGPFRVELTSFFHPWAGLLSEQLASRGVWALYAPEDPKLLRQAAHAEPLDSEEEFWPSITVARPLPADTFDFSTTGAYSHYNWELFFHAPMLIASKLGADRRHAESQRWTHAIFNPIDRVQSPDDTAGSSCWRLRPLVEQAQAGEQGQLEAMLGVGVSEQEQAAALADFSAQVEAWLAHPFDPHAVARLRPGAYMRAVFMRYLDNLIAWADQLFSRDSIESINEATILYLLAAELLGPRPEQLPAHEGLARSYSQLAAQGLDAFTNVAQALENWIVVDEGPAVLLDADAPKSGWELVPLRSWYFCYPPNPKLLGYWDVVEDRLWKVRHCQNLAGVTRRLPLFQPPIDPALLVQATAAGLDVGEVLAELDAGPVGYRFRHVHAKAVDFCGQLRALGGSLLGALERRDAEELARIRAGHERSLLEAMRDVRVRQVDDAREALAAARANKAVIEHRRRHHEQLLDVGLIAGERRSLELLEEAHSYTQMSHSAQIIASVLGVLPNSLIGSGAFSDFGGVQLSAFPRGWAEALSADAERMGYQAGRARTTADYARRAQDWAFLRGQAELELERVERDIAAARLRLAIAERELELHEQQRDQAREVDAFLRDKFSNAALYDWMVAQLSTLHWQAYELAHEFARRAEAAYRRELAVDPDKPQLISPSYWDDLREGLLAGERLAEDLRRLDKAYMDGDVREFELRKNVSLAQLDPAALHTLRETGECSFSLPAVLFDLDHPGHVLRRIRSLSLTIPAVVGPHTSLGATLTLLGHATQAGPGEAYLPGPVSNERIATSTAVADGGVFQLDFRDERYLPFEYAGAVSSWQLRLPKGLRQFDYRTISDVVVSLAYTARDGGDGHRDAVEGSLVASFNEAFADGAGQLVVVHDAFPDEWARFMSPDAEAEAQTLRLPMDERRFAYMARRQGLRVVGVEFALLAAPSTTAAGEFDAVLDLTDDDDPSGVSVALQADGSHYGGVAQPLPADLEPGAWTLRVLEGAAPAELLDDEQAWIDREAVAGMLMLVRYELEG